MKGMEQLVDNTMTRTVSTPRTESAPPAERHWPLSSGDIGTIARFGFVLFLVTAAIGLLITDVLSDGGLVAADADVNRWFERLRTPTWNTLTDWGSSFSDTVTIVGLLAVLIPTLRVATGKWHSSVLLAGAVALETIVFVTAGLVVGRERPPVEQLDMSPPTASFPSGHTGAAVAFYIGLVLLVYWWTSHRPTRIAAAVVFGSIPVIVGLSRLYRGMHFPTDVLWGAVVGLASVLLFSRVVVNRPEATS